MGVGSGSVVPHNDEGAWAEALNDELLSPRVGSDLLRREVTRRAVTAEEHLARLLKLYTIDAARGPR